MEKREEHWTKKLGIELLHPSLTSGNDKDGYPLRNVLDSLFESFLHSRSTSAIDDIFTELPSTEEERKLLHRLRSATADCQMFEDIKARTLDVCKEEEYPETSVCGLLANTCHERYFLGIALVRANVEREESLAALCQVKEWLQTLCTTQKSNSEVSGTPLFTQITTILSTVNEMVKTPSILFDELSNVKIERQKYLVALAQHQNTSQRRKKLTNDNEELLKNLAEVKRKLNAQSKDLHALQRQVLTYEENETQANKEVTKLTAEIRKLNAVKHENTQLKKKLATIPSSTSINHKVNASNENSDCHGKPPTKESEIKYTHVGVSTESECIHQKLQHLENVLKESEKANAFAVKRHAADSAAIRVLEDTNKSHRGQHAQVGELLKQSLCKITSLGDRIVQLENSLIDTMKDGKSQNQQNVLAPKRELMPQFHLSMKPDIPRWLLMNRVAQNQAGSDEWSADDEGSNSAANYGLNVSPRTTSIVAYSNGHRKDLNDLDERTRVQPYLPLGAASNVQEKTLSQYSTLDSHMPRANFSKAVGAGRPTKRKEMSYDMDISSSSFSRSDEFRYRLQSNYPSNYIHGQKSDINGDVWRSTKTLWLDEQTA